ncbi:GSCOCG00001590001-RA-CDS, partial [Cotesia congregata]
WLCRSCFCSCSLTPPLYSKLLTAALLVTCTQSLLPPRLPRAVLVQVQRGQLGTCIQCPAAPTIHNLFDWTSLSCSHQQHQPTHTCTLTSTHSAVTRATTATVQASRSSVQAPSLSGLLSC